MSMLRHRLLECVHRDAGAFVLSHQHHKAHITTVTSITHTQSERDRDCCCAVPAYHFAAAVSWGAYLYLYERIKSWHRDRQGIATDSGDRLGATWNLLSAAQAGAMVSSNTEAISMVATIQRQQPCCRLKDSNC